MAESEWPEISQALEENRRELVLSGKELGAKVENGGLDKRIYTLRLLNFLEISNVGLSEVSEEVVKLERLVNLVIRENKLTTLPDSICELYALRVLDVSSNKLTELPSEIGNLVGLHTFDASNNELTNLPESIHKLIHLSVCKVSTNKLTNIDHLVSADLVHLTEIIASGNKIESLGINVVNLQVLKKLDLSANQIRELPASLADCGKIRDLDFKDNPIKDRRLAKLIQQGKGHKAILDYVQEHGFKTQTDHHESKGKPPKKGKKKRRKRGSEGSTGDELATLVQVITVRATDLSDNVEIVITKEILDVRPYIVCCIVRDVDLDRGNMMKRFISAQTKLHDGPLCAKRTKATIATHDLTFIKGPLKYDARLPDQIEIIPLGRKQLTTAGELVMKLHKEADDLRKCMKRNTISGIHRYLDLLAEHDMYPCLMDNENRVISFPPITNSDITKISKSTTNLFIEVTSPTDLATCKKVMDTLIEKMVELGMSNVPPTEDIKNDVVNSGETASNDLADDLSEADPTVPPLHVQQVRVLDENGGLRVVYPSRTDLDIQGIKVLRDKKLGMISSKSGMVSSKSGKF